MADESAVPLTGEEYWELRARATDVECADLAVSLTPQAQQLRIAKDLAVKTLDVIITKYNLDASSQWTLDETMKALIPVQPPTPPKE